MNIVFEWLSKFLASWKPWIVIAPWDVGVRVRLGKTAAVLPPGLHLRIPFIDHIVIVNTRQRVSHSSSTCIESENFIEVRSGIVLFSVIDPALALMNYKYPDALMSSLLSAAIVNSSSEEEVLKILRLETDNKGIRIDSVKIVEKAKMRCYRIISGGAGPSWYGSTNDTHSDPVSTF